MADTPGDRAAAKGLAVFPDTQDLREGYANDNTRGDELADEIDARTAADALKLDASKIIISATDPGNVPDKTLWFQVL